MLLGLLLLVVLLGLLLLVVVVHGVGRVGRTKHWRLLLGLQERGG